MMLAVIPQCKVHCELKLCSHQLCAITHLATQVWLLLADGEGLSLAMGSGLGHDRFDVGLHLMKPVRR